MMNFERQKRNQAVAIASYIMDSTLYMSVNTSLEMPVQIIVLIYAV